MDMQNILRNPVGTGQEKRGPCFILLNLNNVLFRLHKSYSNVGSNSLNMDSFINA